jgi:hypothetical protein
MRTPRPSGLTVLSQRLHKAQTEEERTRLKKDITRLTIMSYVQQGYTFLGQPQSISVVAMFLGVTNGTVMREMARYTKTLASIADPERTQETMQAMTGMLLQNAMSDRSRIEKQVNLLLAAQGDGYKAFVSGEVNKSFKLLLDSNKPLADILKILQGPGTVNIANQNNNQLNAKEEAKELKEKDSLSAAEAVLLISEKDPVSLLEDRKKQAILMEKEMGDDYVEVIAIKQKGFELQGKNAGAIPIKRGVHTERNENDGEIVESEFEEIDV